MDYALVIEDEDASRVAITRSLAAINEGMKVKFFRDLEEYYRWLRGAVNTAGSALGADPGDTSQERVRLLVASSSIVSALNLSVLRKSKELFLKRNLCSIEEPTNLVITAFDEPNFKIEKYKQPDILNLIFKPFDEVILTQHLSSALKGHKKPEAATLTGQRTSAKIEVLLGIPVKALTDIGFISTAKKIYEVGALSKYYSTLFTSQDSRAIYARLRNAEQKGAENFELSYHFFAADQNQISNFRKIIRSKEKGPPTEIPPKATQPLSSPNIVVIEPDDNEFNQLAAFLKRRLAGVQIFHFKSRKEFYDDLNLPYGSIKGISGDAAAVTIAKDLTIENSMPADVTLFNKPLIGFKLATVIAKHDVNRMSMWLLGGAPEILLMVRTGPAHAVLKFRRVESTISIIIPTPTEKVEFLRKHRISPGRVDMVLLGGDVEPHNLEPIADLKRLLQQELGHLPSIHSISKRSLNDDEKRKMGAQFDDVFFQPLDRPFFLMKLQYRHPGLKILEDQMHIAERPNSEKVYAATTVSIDEISEAGVSFKYPGIIDPGSYREFVLGRQNDPNVPVLTGVCYSRDTIEGTEPTHQYHFVFFAVKDQELKFIRVWLRENYVHSKEGKE